MLLKCKYLKTIDLVGIKKLNDSAFEPAMAIEEQQKDSVARPRTALDSLRTLNLAMCDYVSDKLLQKIK